MTNLFFVLILVILTVEFILGRLLDFLNSTYWSGRLPDQLKGIYNPWKYKKSQLYERAHHKIGMSSSVLSFALMLLAVWFGLFGWLDEILRTCTEHFLLVPLLFFLTLGLISDLLGEPFSICNTFCIEQRFGFNKTTAGTYVLDKLKGYLLMLVLGGGLLSLVLWLFETAGNVFWLYAWGIITLFAVFMTMFYSNLIVPLFNKQTPLDHGELRDAIQAFATQADFMLADIYVIDGSKRSTKANAYFTGLGPKKRIVLYDTLIKQHTTEELVAILAHEVGHYKKRHTLTGMAMTIIQTGFMLYLLSLFVSRESPYALSLCMALGAEQQSFHVGLLAFGVLYSPLSLLLGLLMNILSRRNEFQADRFARDHFGGLPLQNALKKLSVNNLSNLRPHPWYVFFYYSHPPLLKRLKALEMRH